MRVPRVSHRKPGFITKQVGFFLALVLFGSVARAQSDEPQKMPWQIGSSALAGKQNNAVIFLSPEQITLPAGKLSNFDLHFRIADGLHINSHKPHDASLVPTQILVAESNGLDTRAIDFPAGADTAFAFAPNQKLNVYQGELVVHVHLSAKPGNHLWQAVMRYQACNNSQCLPPKKVAAAVDIIAK
jgi:hypothetical protein